MRLRYCWTPILAVVLACLAAPVAVRTAAAHAELLDSLPAAGAEVTAPPTEVRLTFTANLSPESRIEVLDAGFRPVTAGPAVVDAATPSTMRAPLAPLAPGDYTVQYRAVDPMDGHGVDGSFAFRVLGAATGVGSAAAPTRAAAVVAATAVPGSFTPPAAGEASTPSPATAEQPPWFYFAVALITVLGMLAYSLLRRGREPRELPPLEEE